MHVELPLNVLAPHLRDADILSYRNGPFPTRNPLKWPGWGCGRAIGIAGRSDDCHTAMVEKSDGQVIALGMRFRSQKLLLLEDEVNCYPGLIDVYRFMGYSTYSGDLPAEAPPYFSQDERRRIVAEVRQFALHNDYGTLNVLRTSVYFVPVVRLWARPKFHDVDNGKRPPFCSQAVHSPFRKRKLPLLFNRADCEMLPGDVTASPLLLKIGTLMPADPDANPDVASYYAKALKGAA